MKTVSAKKETSSRKWFVVDATGKTLGRLSTHIANRLRGKHKAEFTPHVDTGDYVVVVNAEKIVVSGNKASHKLYHHHTGYPGGINSISFEEMRMKSPERIIEKAVKGMMPKNKLSRAMLSKLKVYAGNEHPHSAQQPTPLEI
jgi:large subunit ribosomal protein L13